MTSEATPADGGAQRTVRVVGPVLIALGLGLLPGTRTAGHEVSLGTQWGRHVAVAALLFAGLALVAWAWRQRAGRAPRVERLFGAAPSAEEPGHEDVAPQGASARMTPSGADAGEVEAAVLVVRDERLAAGVGTEVPRIQLRAADAAYRDHATGAALLVGPGQVNALEVPAGGTSPLCDGDVVQLGSTAELTLAFRPARAATLRYHYAGPGRLRVVARVAPDARARTTTGLAVCAAAVGAWWACAPGSHALVVAAAALGGYVAALASTPPRRGVFRLASLRAPESATLEAPGGTEYTLESARVDVDDDGAFRLVVSTARGASVVVEDVPAPPRDAGAAVLALHAALRREALVLCARFVALAAGDGAPARDAAELPASE